MVPHVGFPPLPLGVQLLGPLLAFQLLLGDVVDRVRPVLGELLLDLGVILPALLELRRLQFEVLWGDEIDLRLLVAL